MLGEDVLYHDFVLLWEQVEDYLVMDGRIGKAVLDAMAVRRMSLNMDHYIVIAQARIRTRWYLNLGGKV